MATRTETMERARSRAREQRAWIILGVLLLFSIAAPLNQFKVPPIMPVLMDALGLSVGRAGLLMSVYAVTGLILALPSGLIFARAGARATGLIAGGSIVLGAAVGALSGSMGSLLASRVIEGAGLSFMAVLAPAIIAQQFAAEKRATAMGIFSVWVPVGTAVMLLVAPAVAGGGNWRAVWWIGAIYAAVVTALYLAVVRPSPQHAGNGPVVENAVAGQVPRGAAPSTGQVLRSRDLWLLALAFGAFNMALGGMGTFMPTYLSAVRGLPLGQAGLIASISTLVTIFSCPAGGVISDRIRSRKGPFVVGLVASGLLAPLAGWLGVGMLVALFVVMGLVMGLVPTNIFSAAVEAAGDERHGGLAMAVIMVGQNGGMLLGPVTFGALVETGGWVLAFGSLAVILVLGAAAGWLARVR